jgi:hypothetical protein
MYKRSKVYPNGAPLPESLPDSYQPAAYGNAPAGQSCFTCKHFNMTTRNCSAWDAPVKPRWWCDDWAPVKILVKNNVSNGSNPSAMLTKKITTSTVEEHFSETPNLKPMEYDFNDYYKNEEDVIKINVPLMIRLLEWAREEAWKDVDLHVITERLIELSEEGDTLTMSDYPEIVWKVELEKKENTCTK